MSGKLSRLMQVLILLSPIMGHSKEYIVKQKVYNPMHFNVSSLARIVDQHQTGRLLKIDIPESKSKSILAAISQDSNTEYIVPSFKLYAFKADATSAGRSIEVIQGLKEQWANKKVHVSEAWALAKNKGSRSVIVSIIDTGIDYNHESLKANMIPGYDFRDNDDDPMDETSRQNPGHGTHCAGSLAGTGLAEGGIEGMAPVLSLMPIRFLGADGSGDLMAGIKAIDYAIEKGVHVISASWGATVGRKDAAPLIEAVQRADAAGIIFVAAAANDGRSNDRTDVFPANAGTPNMITVAASGSNDEKPSWSNYGQATVSLAAPGLDIMSSLPKNSYGNLSGTSMATPLVAGLVALLKAQDLSLTGQQIRSLLQVTGADAPIETACNCRVNAATAMDYLVNKKPWLYPAALTIKPGATEQLKMFNADGAVTFSSSDPNVASIDANGVVQAQNVGEVIVSATDSLGHSAQSKIIRIANASGGGGGGGGGGGANDCPFQDPALCDMICKIQPTLPWCKQ